MFACTTHRVLLRDTCPACGQVPRIYASLTWLNPPATCAGSLARGRCCGADLREMPLSPLKPGSPVLASQHQIHGLLSVPGGELGDRAASTLGDLGIVASWVLRTGRGLRDPRRAVRMTDRLSAPTAGDHRSWRTVADRYEGSSGAGDGQIAGGHRDSSRRCHPAGREDRHNADGRALVRR